MRGLILVMLVSVNVNAADRCDTLINLTIPEEISESSEVEMEAEEFCASDSSSDACREAIELECI